MIESAEKVRLSAETGLEEEDESLLFYCRCESAKSVSTLLSSLRQFASRVGGGNVSFPSTHVGEVAQPSLSVMVDHLSAMDGGKVTTSKKGIRSVQQVTVYAHPGGLTFHVHGIGRQSQASVDMQCGLFSDYSVASERIPTGVNGATTDVEGINVDEAYENVVGGEFCVNLPTVIDSLHVLGLQNLDRTKVCMSYNRKDAIFKVELEDRGVLATAAISGSVPEFQYDDNYDDGEDANDFRERGIATSSLAVAFRNHPVVARAIVKSDFFRSAVTELADIAGAMICSVGISPTYIEIGTVGHSGECLVYLPKSSEAFTSLECNPPTLHMRSYHLYSLLQGMRGLDIAQETCISINANGMIAIQHQVLDVVGSSEANFIDFLMCAVQEDDEHSQSSDDDPRFSLTTKALSTNQRSSATRDVPVVQHEHAMHSKQSTKQKAVNTSLDSDEDDSRTTEDDSDDYDGDPPANKYKKLEPDSAPSLRISRRSSLLQPTRNNTVNTRLSSLRKRNGTIPSHKIPCQEMDEEVSGKVRTATTSQREMPKRDRRSLEGCDSPEIVFGSTRPNTNENCHSPSNLFDNYTNRGKSSFRDKNGSETEEEEFN